MRPPDSVLTKIGGAKTGFLDRLVELLTLVEGVRSVTVTGSFVESESLEGVSDIDVVLIVEDLTPDRFKSCCEQAAKANPEWLGLPNHRLLVNSSFGPLKFDDPDTVVIHLMVYSTESHRNHVLKSPFTCLDWERSPVVWGESLREIYPVLRLQPRQLLEGRRGLLDYLNDLDQGGIRYRFYSEEGGALVEKSGYKNLDARHAGEFAYHIVRNFLSNCEKLVSGSNHKLGLEEVISFWKKELPATSHRCDWFRDLAIQKLKRSPSYPPETLQITRDLLITIDQDLREIWSQGVHKLGFVRHAKTAKNDGRFLGSRSNPGILEPPSPLNSHWNRLVTSPLIRARETAAALCPQLASVTDERLIEIDYGLAEGLTYAQLQSEFPVVTSGWGRAEDPSFPEGESTGDVVQRLFSFLADQSTQEGSTLVVTHNVVIRCLVGKLLKLPMQFWHWVPIDHLELFEVLVRNGTPYLNLTAGQIERITDALYKGGYRG